MSMCGIAASPALCVSGGSGPSRVCVEVRWSVSKAACVIAFLELIETGWGILHGLDT